MDKLTSDLQILRMGLAMAIPVAISWTILIAVVVARIVMSKPR